ncbi:MAG: carboxypeptidase regulatory-like domain-containing protein [Anaerolineales bacterium]|nr:carboxypeptidase regulatory-like domain-containing protein [Anaerolineales bacterium]
MKNYFRVALLITIFCSSLAFQPRVAYSRPLAGDPAPENPTPAAPAADSHWVYLPLVTRAQEMYIVSGKVRDESANPLAGATVTDSAGRIAVTGADGSYLLNVTPGQLALSPSKDGYVFSPSVTDLSVSGNLANQDFVATVACNEAIANGGFENNTWWGFPASDWPASYANDLYHSGARSVRMGIRNLAENRYSYSSVRSPAISIPSDSANVTLRLWLYPFSSEPASAPLPAPPDGPTFAEAPLAYDAQYVMILDASDQILEIPLWTRSNSQIWAHREFNLTKWAGRTIKIQIGVYNDGAPGVDGVTAMYADDVSLQVCPGASPPAPGACSNQLANSSFETNSAWNIPYTSYPAAYSTDYAYGGSRSMRTGIPLWSASNVYSYSDAWQTAYIPANATKARLYMRLLPRSQEAPALAPEQPPAVGAEWGLQPLAYDAQYVLILDPSTGYILETLLWWQPKNSSNWLYREFDLLKYKGQSVRIQFGTYNNGYGGRSVMYADKVMLETCVSTTPPPPPPPPPTCSERVANGGFESNSAWYIPLTDFSAGYSTWLAHYGARSMRSGIVYQSHNRYSYSDFRQTVSIPSGASSAVLSFWAYSISGESYSLPESERPTAAEFGESAMAGDVQYLLVLDYYGNWLDTLLWRRSNEQYWRYFQYNLTAYAGQTILLQWGTYNNGWDGVTAMYVDDVFLQACP